jgi:hypothetical protein
LALASAFGLVHRGVGAGDELLGGQAELGAGDADAGAERDLGVGSRERRGERGGYALRACGGVGLRGTMTHEEELVSAEPRDEVPFAKQSGLQLTRHNIHYRALNMFSPPRV